MTQANRVHSTPPTNAPINQIEKQRAEHFEELELPMRQLRCMVEIVQIVCGHRRMDRSRMA